MITYPFNLAPRPLQVDMVRNKRKESAPCYVVRFIFQEGTRTRNGGTTFSFPSTIGAMRKILSDADCCPCKVVAKEGGFTVAFGRSSDAFLAIMKFNLRRATRGTVYATMNKAKERLKNYTLRNEKVICDLREEEARLAKQLESLREKVAAERATASTIVQNLIRKIRHGIITLEKDTENIRRKTSEAARRRTNPVVLQPRRILI